MTSRLLSLSALVIATAMVWSCGDRTATGPGAATSVLEGPLAGRKAATDGLVNCTPLEAASVTQYIGPWGGQIRVGPHILTVPPLALSRTVKITAKIPRESSVNYVVLKPDGLTFQLPALLTMSYANCAAGTATSLRVSLIDDGLAILSHLLSTMDTSTQTVTGVVQHFSNYAVAW